MRAPRIPDEWRDHVVPIDAVQLYPGNAKLHDVDAVRRSLRRRGQYRMAVVQRSTGHVLVGNGMVEAMRAEGWTELAVHYRDVDDDEARELLLFDNRSGELAGYDVKALVDLLASLPTLEHTGYPAELFADLQASVAPLSLDELHEKYGDPTDDDTHVRLVLSVPPEVAALWREAAAATGLTDTERDVALVRAAHGALVGQRV